MGPTWVLSAPDGPHIGPMNLAIKEHIVIHVIDEMASFQKAIAIMSKIAVLQLFMNVMSSDQ